MKYLIIVSPSDLFLCSCFRCCGDSQLSFEHRLCVSQWSLRRVPPGVRQQGRLCWWIRWDRLRWVQMDVMSRFILLLSRKTTFSLLSLSQTTFLACLELAVSTWMEIGGRRPASSPRTMTMTLIGGSASRAKHLGQARTLTTALVSTHPEPNTVHAPVKGTGHHKMKNCVFYLQAVVPFVFDCFCVSCRILENETKCPSRNSDTPLIKIFVVSSFI